jgi:hypothetical protein
MLWAAEPVIRPRRQDTFLNVVQVRSMCGRPRIAWAAISFAEIQFQGLRACTKPLPQAALNSSAEILPSLSTSTMWKLTI